MICSGASSISRAAAAAAAAAIKEYKKECRTDFSCFKSDNFPNACQIESEFATQIWLIYFARQQPFTLHFECEREREHPSNISNGKLSWSF